MSAILTVYLPALLSGSASGNDTLAGLLQSATSVVTWLITTMGSYLTFVLDNPAVLMMFLILLAGAGVAFLMRIWHSA